MPAVTFAGMLTVNSSWTLPPPGSVKLDHAGVVAPTAAFAVDGRVAPPASETVGAADWLVNALGVPGSASEMARPVVSPRPAAFVTMMRYTTFVPGARESGPAATVCLVTVSCGRQRAPAIAPPESPAAVTVP